MVIRLSHFRLFVPNLGVFKYDLSSGARQKGVVYLQDYPNFRFAHMTSSSVNSLLHFQSSDKQHMYNQANELYKEYEEFVKKENLKNTVLWKENFKDNWAYMILKNEHFF